MCCLLLKNSLDITTTRAINDLNMTRSSLQVATSIQNEDFQLREHIHLLFGLTSSRIKRFSTRHALFHEVRIANYRSKKKNGIMTNICSGSKAFVLFPKNLSHFLNAKTYNIKHEPMAISLFLMARKNRKYLIKHNFDFSDESTSC